MSSRFPVELKQKWLLKAERFRIKSEDVEESFKTGSGKGGQKINKTTSCVELKHKLTGIVIQCQKYREQAKNRMLAYRMLIDKIEETLDWKNSEKAKKQNKLKKQKQKRAKRAKAKVNDADAEPSD
tara:strand:- start:316 stop:693 length:378 start_codon:yes stop_codon:yes gene_type:complete